MEAIELMVKEHDNIRRVLKLIRNISYRVLNKDEYDLEDFPKIIDFVRTYADKHHHGKEEDILFETMKKDLEAVAKSGAITGMYIEHDMGRLYMANLEKALEEFVSGSDKARLDIIANAVSYANLLERHIEKENTALYKLAERMLKEDSKTFIDKESKKVEDLASKAGLQDKYIALIDKLENKYMD